MQRAPLHVGDQTLTTLVDLLILEPIRVAAVRTTTTLLDAAKRREIAESVISGRKSGAEMARLYIIHSMLPPPRQWVGIKLKTESIDIPGLPWRHGRPFPFFGLAATLGPALPHHPAPDAGPIAGSGTSSNCLRCTAELI